MEELQLNKKNNRRDFLKKISAGAALATLGGIPLDAFAKKELVKITVLHTNDVHSHIEPFPDNDPKYAGMGGVAQRSAMINKIRSEEKNVLLFDSGDIFQGTPYFNLYGGELEMKLMSMMQYDASTIGNHDFDNGIEGLAKQLPNATFPLLNCNYDFSSTVLKDKTPPYKIFDRDGIKIGVFGLGIELKGLVDPKLYQKTIYLDPLQKAAETAHLLKKEKKCDLVICLSHLGFKYPDEKVSDIVLAKKSMNIDLILGGHTHTFIDDPYKYINREGKEVLIAQVGWAGIRLGRIDYYFETKTKKSTANATTLKVSRLSSEI
ncbi:MAG TPA: metallophosphoesterase [Bacteroidia bacterium]|nr:metallophosphoesterase [Bacteroidia bacterium]